MHNAIVRSVIVHDAIVHSIIVYNAIVHEAIGFDFFACMGGASFTDLRKIWFDVWGHTGDSLAVREPPVLASCIEIYFFYKKKVKSGRQELKSPQIPSL